jgi:hypothetical protein
MFAQPYLNDSFMIRKIIVAAVPAALVAVGMSLAISEPVNANCEGSAYDVLCGSQRGSQRRHPGFEGVGGMGGATNTNQVYPNNQRVGFLNLQGGVFQLSSGGGRGGHRSAGY